jgi:hypothetical protein
MRRTQIADSALKALWQGLVLQGALLLLVVLVFGLGGDSLRIYCSAMAAQLLTTGCILARRPTEPTRADRAVIRFGIGPLWVIAYLAAPWVARLINIAGRWMVG